MGKELIEKVGRYCREYRVNVLKLSLTDFCKMSDSNIKNVSAFENGRANNITYLMLYWKLTTIESDRVEFLKGMFHFV